VKLHAHGAIEADFDAMFGEKAFEMHRLLNERYNDGRRFRLHYVTARQACNIVKAAEDGKDGSPADWVDYRIKPPATRFYSLDARHEPARCTESRLTVGHIEATDTTHLRTWVGPFSDIAGPLDSIDIDDDAGSLRFGTRTADAEVMLTWRGAPQAIALSDGEILKQESTSRGGTIHVRPGPHCTLRYRGAVPASAAPVVEPGVLPQSAHRPCESST
jgi:hypothetical protein